MSSSTAGKPTIIIVPGAWCRPGIYDPLASHLQQAGYKTRILDLPSNGDPPSFAPDWQPDINLISSIVKTYADEGDRIVLVAHSAGGATTTEAVRGLSVEDRKATGKSGGVERLVYIAAFAPEIGVSPLTHEEVRDAFYWALIEDEIDYPDPELGYDILFNDLSPDDLAKYRPYIQKSAWRARQHAETEVTYVGWKHVPSSYLVCQNDKAVPPEMQEAIVAQEGSKFDDVFRIQAGHFPFISQPEVTAKFVRRAAGEKDIDVQ